MEYQGTESQTPHIMESLTPDTSRAVDDYRVMVETVIDTGEELLMVSPFTGNAFTANFWNVPIGEVELDELPDEAALRIAREATNLLVELTEPAILRTRVVKTERNGKVYRRLIYTYAIGVRRDTNGELLQRFCLNNDYVGYTWLKHGQTDILERKFDSLDPTLRLIVTRYMGIQQ